MSVKIMFDTIEEMVAEIVPGDDRSAYCVQYRGKDNFALATDEDAAIAEVAKSMGMKVGSVPVDLIVAAARNLALRPATLPPAAAAPVAAPVDVAALAKPVAEMTVKEVRALAKTLGIDAEGKPREQLEAAIFDVKPEWKTAAA